MSDPIRDAGRALVADRARAARAVLRAARAEIVRDARSRGSAAQAHAALARFAASSGELVTTDRFACRVAQAWLDTARSHLWFGTAECADAEAMAYDYLQALPGGTCPRSAVRRTRRCHRAGLRRWHACHSARIAELVARVRG